MGKEGPSVNDNVVATIEKDWTAEEEEKVKRKYAHNTPSAMISTPA